MQVVKAYPDGLFSWVDLATSDLDGAKAFYGSLFGWEAEDVPVGDGSVYVMFRIEGHNVAGAGELDAERKAQGVPPHWASYINHSDVDTIAGRAAGAGGQVLFPPMDVLEDGRMTMIQDPAGAIFGVWQPRNHIGAQLVNRPGALVWNELQTRDLEAAKAFYTDVFGWEPRVDAQGYVACYQEGRAHAGMMAMDDEWDENIPPNWAVYFMVDDIEETADRVKQLGGTIIVPPTTAGELGKFAVIQDPQGGVFTAMEFQGPVAPPPGY